MAQTSSSKAITGRGEFQFHGSYNAHGNQIARYTKLFFSTIGPDELSVLMVAGDQVAIIAELHKRNTISAIVKSIARTGGAMSANAESEMADTVEDYIQTVTLMLLTLAKRNKFKLHLSPGEVAGYICQWILQKIHRRIQSEFKLRNDRAETTRDIEDYSVTPEFDNILIARQALKRDEDAAETAKVFDMATARKAHGRAKAESKTAEKGGKLVRMKDPRSRAYQTKIKKDALRGVFNLVSKGLRHPATILPSKAVAGAV